MHEVGLMQDAMEIVTRHANAAHAQRVRAIRMRVGELSGVVPDALEFAFGVVSRDTPAAGARLEIECVSVACFCEACRAEFEPRSPRYECPVCGLISMQVRRGREFQVMSIEVD